METPESLLEISTLQIERDTLLGALEMAVHTLECRFTDLRPGAYHRTPEEVLRVGRAAIAKVERG